MTKGVPKSSEIDVVINNGDDADDDEADDDDDDDDEMKYLKLATSHT